MDRVGISFKSTLTGDEVRERYVRPLRAALEGAKLGFYSNYLRQGDNDTGPQEHLLVFQVFDFHAGLQPEPPAWVQRAGLQWFQRLLGNPRRLWRRYLILNPRYVAGVVRQRLGRAAPGEDVESPPFVGYA